MMVASPGSKFRFCDLFPFLDFDPSRPLPPLLALYCFVQGVHRCFHCPLHHKRRSPSHQFPLKMAQSGCSWKLWCYKGQEPGARSFPRNPFGNSEGLTASMACGSRCWHAGRRAASRSPSRSTRSHLFSWKHPSFTRRYKETFCWC